MLRFFLPTSIPIIFFLGSEKNLIFGIIGCLATNLIIDFFIFGIAFLIFLRKTEIFKLKNFLISLLLTTVISTFALISGYLIEEEIWGLSEGFIWTISSFFLILLLNFILCELYLNINFMKSLYIAVWMAVLTGPFLQYVIASIF